MKTKQIQWTLLGMTVISSLAIVSSCQKFISLTPESTYVASGYKTSEDFSLAAKGTYVALRNIYVDYTCVDLDCHSDDMAANTGGPQGDFSHFTVTSGSSDLGNFWPRFYNTINLCNTMLDQLSNGAFPDSVKNIYQGEASFVRGYCYFQLGWLYGGVPLVAKVSTAEEIAKIKRSTQDETLAFAANDLKIAANLLPAEWPSGNLGRATKYAAEGILARVYLFKKNYTAAKPFLEDIIKSNKYPLFQNFADIFKETNNNQGEHIFEIQHKSGNNQGNSLVYSYLPPCDPTKNGPKVGDQTDSTQAKFKYTRSTWTAFSNNLYNSFESGDRRREVTLRKGYKTTNATDRTSIFYIKYTAGSVPGSSTDYAVNKSILRMTDVFLMYAEVLNETGGPTAAGVADSKLGMLTPISILSAIRNRAGLSPVAPVDIPSGREAIFLERRHEFVGEFMRWFDIVRQGAPKAMQIINTFLMDESGTTDLTGRFGAGAGMQEGEVLLPIQAGELQLNPDTNYLWQNPGY